MFRHPTLVMRYQVGENSHRIGLGQLRPSLPSAWRLINYLVLSSALSPVSGHYAKSNSFTGPYCNILEANYFVSAHPHVLVGIISWSKCATHCRLHWRSIRRYSSETLNESNLLSDHVNCFFRQHRNHMVVHAIFCLIASLHRTVVIAILIIDKDTCTVLSFFINFS